MEKEVDGHDKQGKPCLHGDAVFEEHRDRGKRYESHDDDNLPVCRAAGSNGDESCEFHSIHIFYSLQGGGLHLASLSKANVQKHRGS